MKRILAFALSICMVLCLLSFVGCGEQPEESKKQPAETTNQPTESTADSSGATDKSVTPDETTVGTEASSETTGGTVTPPVDELDGIVKLPGYEDVDFRGTVITIAAHGDCSNGWDCDYEIYSEDRSTIAVAARKRNDIMKKNYNCEIKLVKSEDPKTLATADVTGNTHTIDLYSIQYFTGNYPNVYNLLDFDIDFTNPWWDQQWVKTASIKDNNGEAKMFSVIGDFALTSGRATFALMYDRTVYRNAGIQDDVYQLVRDKKWTMDKFMEMIRVAAKENSGNSELKYSEGDLMGCLTSNFCPHALHAASGLSIISVEDGIQHFAVSDNIEAWSDVIDKAIEIWSMPELEDVGYAKVHEAMNNQGALFYLKDLGSLDHIADADVSLGLLPLPLYSELQSNYAQHVDDHVMHYAVPISVTDIDGMADFLELFAYHSRYTTRVAWIDTYSIEYCGDIESGEMLDIILSTRTYDPGYLYFQLEGEISSMITNKKNSITKWANRFSPQAADKISAFLSVRTGLNN